MSSPEVRVFFYGSFINRDVLGEVGLVPGEVEVARLHGFDIRIEPLANIVREERGLVYGIVCLANHADLGRLYLPWISRAAVDGQAELVFQSGQRVDIRTTPFLNEARGTLLARYAELRCARLDAVLERAGILSHYADFTAHAGNVPDCEKPPQRSSNRPFPPPWEAES